MFRRCEFSASGKGFLLTSEINAVLHVIDPGLQIPVSQGDFSRFWIRLWIFTPSQRCCYPVFNTSALSSENEFPKSNKQENKTRQKFVHVPTFAATSFCFETAPRARGVPFTAITSCLQSLGFTTVGRCRDTEHHCQQIPVKWRPSPGVKKQNKTKTTTTTKPKQRKRSAFQLFPVKQNHSEHSFYFFVTEYS